VEAAAAQRHDEEDEAAAGEGGRRGVGAWLDGMTAPDSLAAEAAAALASGAPVAVLEAAADRAPRRVRAEDLLGGARPGRVAALAGARLGPVSGAAALAALGAGVDAGSVAAAAGAALATAHARGLASSLSRCAFESGAALPLSSPAVMACVHGCAAAAAADETGCRDDPRVTSALREASAVVRGEALRAWKRVWGAVEAAGRATRTAAAGAVTRVPRWADEAADGGRRDSTASDATAELGAGEAAEAGEAPGRGGASEGAADAAASGVVSSLRRLAATSGADARALWAAASALEGGAPPAAGGGEDAESLGDGTSSLAARFVDRCAKAESALAEAAAAPSLGRAEEARRSAAASLAAAARAAVCLGAADEARAAAWNAAKAGAMAGPAEAEAGMALVWAAAVVAGAAAGAASVGALCLPALSASVSTEPAAEGGAPSSAGRPGVTVAAVVAAAELSVLEAAGATTTTTEQGAAAAPPGAAFAAAGEAWAGRACGTGAAPPAAPDDDGAPWLAALWGERLALAAARGALAASLADAAAADSALSACWAAMSRCRSPLHRPAALRLVVAAAAVAGVALPPGSAARCIGGTGGLSASAVAAAAIARARSRPAGSPWADASPAGGWAPEPGAAATPEAVAAAVAAIGGAAAPGSALGAAALWPGGPVLLARDDRQPVIVGAAGRGGDWGPAPSKAVERATRALPAAAGDKATRGAAGSEGLAEALGTGDGDGEAGGDGGSPPAGGVAPSPGRRWTSPCAELEALLLWSGRAVRTGGARASGWRSSQRARWWRVREGQDAWMESVGGRLAAWVERAGAAGACGDGAAAGDEPPVGKAERRRGGAGRGAGKSAVHAVSGPPAAGGSLPPRPDGDLSSLRVVDLRALLKAAGVKTSGLKAALVLRAEALFEAAAAAAEVEAEASEEADAEEEEAEASDEACPGGTASPGEERAWPRDGCVRLFLGPGADALPWEAALAAARPGTVAVRAAAGWGDAAVPLCVRVGAAVVNPSGDLASTEAALGAAVRQRLVAPPPGGPGADWTLLLGGGTDAAAFRSAAGRGGAFLYSGHGAGLAVCPREDLSSLGAGPLSPLCLVMGCSSHRPTPRGGAASSVPAHAYWAGGARATAGCLWDVTDGDVDRFTAALVAGMAAPGGPRPLSALLSEARAVCRLPFLTAAAVVAHGADLPVILTR